MAGLDSVDDHLLYICVNCLFNFFKEEFPKLFHLCDMISKLMIWIILFKKKKKKNMTTKTQLKDQEGRDYSPSDRPYH